MQKPTPQQDEVVIAVMGSTGTGKSSFIRLLTGDDNVKVGNSLDSETSDVQIVRFTDRTTGRQVTIVDTPGFDDSRAGVTDTDILKTITQFLLDEYDQDRKLTGLIYLTRISDPRFGGQSSRNLRMFRSLCGSETYKNVVVLTTFWDQLPSAQEGEKREAELRSKFFKDLVAGGARFMRHDCTQIESAKQVLAHVLTLAPAVVQIQEEIRVRGKTLEDTEAGSVHREEVERIISKHKKEVAELKEEMNVIKESNVAARAELEEERKKLQEQLQRWEQERQELRRGLDEEAESRRRLEAQAAIEKEAFEKLREEQELAFAGKFKEHEDSLQQLQTELEQERNSRGKLRREDSVREAIDRAVGEQRKKSYMRKGIELAEEIPLVPNFIAKPYLGGLGLALDGAKKIFS